MPDTPLNPDGLSAAGRLYGEIQGCVDARNCAGCKHEAAEVIRAYLTVAQPELQANSKPNQNFEVVNSFDPRELNRHGWTCGCEPGDYNECEDCQSACEELADFLNRLEATK